MVSTGGEPGGGSIGGVDGVGSVNGGAATASPELKPEWKTKDTVEPSTHNWPAWPTSNCPPVSRNTDTRFT
ncbi:hypothetical protein ACOPJQ_08810 [Luteimonas dalianensis]|uniref:hypothetical protein n=1 Tax=Luteimonas dalianensis TaxID=1148196 RepID=UPI003BF20E07